MLDETIAIRPHASMAQATLAAIAALDATIFADHPFATAYSWAGPDWHVLLYQDGQIASYLNLLERQATHGSAPVHLIGVGTVMTIPAARGRGLSRQVLAAAQDFILHRQRADVGMLFCTPDIVPFYEQLGWQVVHAPVTIQQPDGPRTWPHTAMVLPRDPAHWHAAPIDVGGLPW